MKFHFLSIRRARLGHCDLVCVIHETKSHYLAFFFRLGKFFLLGVLFNWMIGDFFQSKQTGMQFILFFLRMSHYQLIKKLASIIDLASLDQVNKMALEIVKRI